MKFFDLLYQRYGDPAGMLDMMLQAGCFYDFIRHTVKTQNEEMKEKTIWELWLHKSNESYTDFREKIISGQVSQDDRPTSETIDASFEMLNGFDPTESE